MKECTNCGALLDDGDLSCRYCSYSLDGSGDFRSYEAPHAPEPPAYEPAPEPSGGAADVAQPADESDTQSSYRQPYQGGESAKGPYPDNQHRYQQTYYSPPKQPPHGQASYQAPPPGQGAYQPPPGPGAYQAPPPYGQPYPGQPGYAAPYYRRADRIVAGILAILLGWIGVHKFYLGKTGQGIVMVIFCWTGIPAIVGLVEGILYLCSDDYTFREKHCRLYR